MARTVTGVPAWRAGGSGASGTVVVGSGGAVRRLRSGTRLAGQLLGGLVLYAASIAMLVHAGLGNMPWDVLGQGVARGLDWSLGTATVVLSVVVLLCWLPLRQRPGVGTLANVAVIGLLVDPFLALLDRLPDPLPPAATVALTLGGIVLNGVATACYIGTRLGPGPRDGLMTGLVARTGWPLGWVRSGIEVSVVLAGWALGGTVGLGTLGYALGIGPLVHLLLPLFTVTAATVAVAAAQPGAPGGPASLPATPGGPPSLPATPDGAASPPGTDGVGSAGRPMAPVPGGAACRQGTTAAPPYRS